MTIAAAIDRYRQESSPREPSASNPFELVSAVDDQVDPAEVAEAWPHHQLPTEASELWAECHTARLFEDAEYGQWGLMLLSARASRERSSGERSARPSDFQPDDVVLGEFLGDQELLVLAPSESGERRVLIALPLDNRSEWYGVAESLAQFLEQYFEHAGDKYWEG